MIAPHITRYHRQLLELICDKLEIDYSEQKKAFKEANKEAKAEAEKLRLRRAAAMEERDRRIAEIEKQSQESQRVLEAKRQKLKSDMDAMRVEKLPSQTWLEQKKQEREQEEQEKERLRCLTPDELADLRASYISADQCKLAAWERYMEAAADVSMSAIDRDKIYDEWKWQSERADQLRRDHKIASEAQELRTTG